MKNSKLLKVLSTSALVATLIIPQATTFAADATETHTITLEADSNSGKEAKPETNKETKPETGKKDDKKEETGKKDDKKPETKKEESKAIGYKTKEDAEKAAKAALKNDKVNNAYDITQGIDGNFYYVLKIKSDVKDGEKEEKPDVTTKVEIRETKAPIKYQASDKLKLGEIGKEPIKKPVNGKVKVTITTKIVNGKEVKEEKKEVLVKEEAGIFEVGNKEVKEEITKFKTIEKKDDTLAKGVKKVKVKGKDGKVVNTITYEINPETGELENPKTEVDVKEKVVDEIVLVGTNEKLAKEQKHEKANKNGEKQAENKSSKLPKAGSAAEIMTLAAGALASIGGIALNRKRR